MGCCSIQVYKIYNLHVDPAIVQRARHPVDPCLPHCLERLHTLEILGVGKGVRTVPARVWTSGEC